MSVMSVLSMLTTAMMMVEETVLTVTNRKRVRIRTLIYRQSPNQSRWHRFQFGGDLSLCRIIVIGPFSPSLC